MTLFWEKLEIVPEFEFFGDVALNPELSAVDQNNIIGSTSKGVPGSSRY